VTAGRGDILVRIRDAAGQVQDLHQGYYLSTQLLGKGRHDFRFTAGAKRLDSTSGQPAYRDWALIGGHAVGLTERLTVGTFVEADKETLAGGLQVGLAIPWIGDVSLDGGVSRDRAAAIGYAAAAAWNRTSRGVSLSASGHWFDDAYSGLGSLAALRTQSWSARAAAGVSIGGRGSLSLEAAAQNLVELVLPEAGFQAPEIVRSRLERVGTRLDVRVLRHVSLRGSAFYNRNVTSGARYWSGSVGLTVSPGKKVTLSSEAIRDEASDTVTTEISRPLSRDRGAAFRVRSTGPMEIGQQRLQAQVEAQNSVAHAAVTVDRDASGGTTSAAMLEGGLIQIGSTFALSRSVTSSFALVKVPSARNVTVYHDHARVGRTSRTGHFLVPDLQAYYGNVLAIEDTDLPLDLLVDETRAVVAPPYRGGAIITFPTRLIRAYTGTVRIAPWPAGLARYGTMFLRREGVELSSPLGSDGSFYVDNAQPGRYEVEIEMGDATCRMTADLPASQTLSTAVGEWVCRLDAGASR
jgi:outer membrane usher protein